MVAFPRNMALNLKAISSSSEDQEQPGAGAVAQSGVRARRVLAQGGEPEQSSGGDAGLREDHHRYAPAGIVHPHHRADGS